MSDLNTFGSGEMDSDDVPGGAGPFGGSRIYETKPLPTISSSASDHPSVPFLSKFDELVMHIDIPQYLTDNKTILRFPDKVSEAATMMINCTTLTIAASCLVISAFASVSRG